MSSDKCLSGKMEGLVVKGSHCLLNFKQNILCSSIMFKRPEPVNSVNPWFNEAIAMRKREIFSDVWRARKLLEIRLASS
jgi:hypothetical protein